MANEEQLAGLKKGVRGWNEWREENPGIGIHLDGAGLRKADLSTANLIAANLGGADLSAADLILANLSGADLREADLSGADLTGADLSGASLIGVDLGGANLGGADLRGADLSAAGLMQAFILGAKLAGADLSRADLREADLRGADLSGACLAEADLSGADLAEARFWRTILSGTVLGSNDLSQVDLEHVVHAGPSILGTATIHKSGGKIPEVFLRGCGLSDLQIEMAKLAAPGLDPDQVSDIAYTLHHLYTEGGQYYSCFISYSSKDQEFARLLHDDLQNHGVRCWLASQDMETGDRIRPAIDRRIRLRDKLLVILSESSVRSEWVGDEVEAALEEEHKEGNRLVLFPVRLDDAVMHARDDWAAKIRRRRDTGDFSNWQDESGYQKAFERLLRDLKGMSAEE